MVLAPAAIEQLYGVVSGTEPTTAARRPLRDLADEAELTPFALHPLGFLRLLLDRRVDGTRLYLHCWPPGPDRMLDPRLQIHQHAFRVDSAVLTGSIVDRVYRWHPAPEPAPHDGRLLLAQTDHVGSHLSATPLRGRPEPVTSRRVEAGDRYSIGLEHFHRTEPDRTALTATLAVFAGQGRPAAFVAAPAVGRFDHRPRRRPLDARSTADLLGQIADHLQPDVLTGRPSARPSPTPASCASD